jgi:hypothetical protein
MKPLFTMTAITTLLFVFGNTLVTSPGSSSSGAALNPVIVASQIAIFGPEKYTRQTGPPQTNTKTFSVQNAVAPFTLIVQNGEGKRGRVSSAVIILNGTRIVGPNDFNKQVDLINKPVSLQQQNQIAVEVRSEPGTSLIVTIMGDAPPVSPITGITLNPDAIFVGEPSSVTIKAAIPYDASQGMPSTTLQRLDGSGGVIATEGTLTDDGNLSNADEIAGDGIFSLRKAFSSPMEGRIRLRISFQQGTLAFNSNIFFLDVFVHLSDAQFDTILTLQNTSRQNYNALVGSLGRDGARNAVLAQAQQNSNILQAGVSENGAGIWMLYTSGVLGALDLNPPGTRGGGITRKTLGAKPVLTQVSVATNNIKNRKAILLAPFYYQFGTDDEVPQINTLLEDSDCPKFDITFLVNNAVTVDVMKTLNQYGIVAISSHGDTYYKGILSLWFEIFGWNLPFGQVVFRTGQVATAANKPSYETDLKKGRLCIVTGDGDHYAVLPSFITYYASSKYPDSLVYVGSCRSTFNNTMANAFLGSGAKTFLGYSEYVSIPFAGQAGFDFFERFIDNPATPTAGQAFISGQHDNSIPPAYFELRGSTALEKPTADLEDGGFELGNLGAWTASGDGRVVSQLGQFAPAQGSFSGIISTGLGFTVSSGSISESVCLPANAQRLEFNWNFCSAEFVEYCGSVFQDFFKVEIITETGTQTIFFRRVDDLCGSVFLTNLVFDRPDVWSTGWQFQSLDISANQGNSVIVRFSAGDVGDSIYDTAILLDGISIVAQ